MQEKIVDNKKDLIAFLDQQKESNKYKSFVWAEALGVFVVSCYGDNFDFHFNRWNEDHGIAFTIQHVSGSRFIVYM